MASLGYGIFFVLSSLHAYFTQTTMIVSDLTDNIKPVYLYMYWCMQFDLTDKKNTICWIRPTLTKGWGVGVYMLLNSRTWYKDSHVTCHMKDIFIVRFYFLIMNY